MYDDSVRPLRPVITFVTPVLTATRLSRAHSEASPASRCDTTSPIGPPELTTTTRPSRPCSAVAAERLVDALGERGERLLVVVVGVAAGPPPGGILEDLLELRATFCGRRPGQVGEHQRPRPVERLVHPHDVLEVELVPAVVHLDHLGSLLQPGDDALSGLGDDVASHRDHAASGTHPTCRDSGTEHACLLVPQLGQCVVVALAERRLAVPDQKKDAQRATPTCPHDRAAPADGARASRTRSS